jgi:hypothetical protein
MGDFSGFPRNLAYSVKSLSGFSKQTVRLTPDNDTSIKASSTIRVKLPPNCLVDLRTFTMFFEGTATATGKVHFPRLSSSVIEQLSVYVNGTMIENIPNYNVLYNTIYDLQCGNDQSTKRHLENIDPSVDYCVDLQTSNLTLYANPSDTNKKMVVNNWLGFIGSASTPVISTSDTNTVEVEIRFAPASILWQAGTTGAVTNADYTINKLRFTISKIVFNDPTYYQLKASKLLSDGLLIGYNTYISNRGSTVAKRTALTYNVSVNASSLDQVIATMLTNNYDTIGGLLLTGNPHDTAGEIFVKALATPTDGNVETFFNNSKYFMRDGRGFISSQFEINNTAMNPYPLPIEEVYNETLIAMGNLNIDVASGVHPGLLSVEHFKSHYFTHILSLENIDNSGQFFKSGLDGRASALNISWKTSFSTTTDCTPFIFCGVTKLLQINEGGQIMVLS